MFDSIDRHLDQIGRHFDRLDEYQYEDRYHAASRLATYFRRLAVIATGDVEELLDARDAGVVSRDEFNKVTTLDFLLRGRDGKGADAPVVYVAFEVSLTGASSDIRRGRARRHPAQGRPRRTRLRWWLHHAGPGAKAGD